MNHYICMSFRIKEWLWKTGKTPVRYMEKLVQNDQLEDKNICR